MKPFTKVPNFIIKSKKLNAYEFRVLVTLLMFPEGRCYPSYANLIQMTGFSRNTVYNALTSLKEKNLVDWEKGNNGLHNNYRVLSNFK